MNLVRKFKPEKILIKKQVKEKRKCRVIYIEADEDHVSHGEKESQPLNKGWFMCMKVLFGLGKTEADW